jgi:hypothetical protein
VEAQKVVPAVFLVEKRVELCKVGATKEVEAKAVL